MFTSTTTSATLAKWLIILLLVMWSRPTWFVHAQSTTSLARPTTGAVSIPASVFPTTTTTYTGVPSLVFQPIATMTACGVGQILWNLYNEDPSRVNITLYAVNDGVDQSIPPASTTSTRPAISTSTAVASAPVATTPSAIRPSTPLTTPVAPSVARTTLSSPASRPAAATLTARSLEERTILHINATLVTQYANHGWDFRPVRLPQGRYYIYGHVDDGRGTNGRSAVFSVVEGNDMACLAAFASASLTASNAGSATSSQASTTSVQTGNQASAGAGAGGSSSGSSSGSGDLSGGAIAGIVVGVILGLGAFGLLAFICLRRRRRNAQYGGSDRPPMSMTGGHRKMASGATSPSDPGHGRAPIPLGTISRADDNYGSDPEKGRDSTESQGGEGIVQSVAPVLTLGEQQQQQQQRERHGKRQLSDPFRTPTFADMPRQPDNAVLAGGSGYEENDFAPVSEDAVAATGSRPKSYTDFASRSMPSSSSVSRSRSQPGVPTNPTPPRSGESTPPLGGPTQVLGRSSSTRRKPVPSLGPELRSEMARQASQNELRGGAPIAGGGGSRGIDAGERRMSYKLVPDPPAIQE
ncbi:hypothetical protein IAR55_005306 [Kwoniella newhampshirensis]|uniref:Mid2 domain-containing protein n=1 Tax=Kwoniella newhampshirensis TaxID=1651941 RepID=A0AAW0YVF0_9TREE